MKKVIDYVCIGNGAIRLYANDVCVGLSNSAPALADLIRRFNADAGPAWKIMASSLFIEAIAGCDSSAQEGGFATGKEVADLWKEVCDYV
jgi:hypothetical protein